MLIGMAAWTLRYLAPLAKRQALCVAVMSYHGKMNFGLLGDYDALPDIELADVDVRVGADPDRAVARLPREEQRERIWLCRAERPFCIARRATAAVGQDPDLQQVHALVRSWVELAVRPALMYWRSPAWITLPLPIESRCWSFPSST